MTTSSKRFFIKRRLELLFWSSPHSKSLWASVAKLGIRAPKWDGDEHFSIGPILLSRNKPIATLDVFHDKERSEIDFALSFTPRPQSQPPKDVLLADKRAGGAKGVRDLVNKSYASSAAPIASYILEFEIPKKSWACKILPRSIKKSDGQIAQIGKQVTLEEIGVRVDGGVFGIDEFSIIYDHINEKFVTKIRARAPIRFVKTTLDIPFFEELQLFALEQFFEKVKQ